MADIDDMINNVVNQDFSKSQTYFDAVMQAKVNDALEQEKIAMANRIFNLDNPDGENYEEPVEASDEEDDVSDEELEAGAEEALDDEDDEEFTEYEFGSDEQDEEEDFSDDEE